MIVVSCHLDTHLHVTNDVPSLAAVKYANSKAIMSFMFDHLRRVGRNGYSVSTVVGSRSSQIGGAALCNEIRPHHALGVHFVIQSICMDL